MQPNDSGYFRVNKSVMACGHVSYATKTEDDGAKIPVCLECLKIKPKEAKTIVSIAGRVAICSFCGKKAKSSPSLVSYFYNIDKDTDTFYDGCRG